MAGTRKRKHVGTEDEQPSKRTNTSKTQSGMKIFAGVSKGAVPCDGLKKRKTGHQCEPSPLIVVVPEPPAANVERKRKRSRGDADSSDDESAAKDVPRVSLLKKLAKKHAPDTTSNKRLRNAPPPSPAGTPSKSAAALLDNLRLDANASAIPFQMSKESAGYDTPPDTSEGEEVDDASRLPPELQDLTRLHAAFLTALFLYYAHNGTTSPANVGAILPMITKNFRKRSVTLQELRKLLALDQSCQQSFFLEDYGRAGICLSRTQPRGRALKRAASYIDEDDLNCRFEQALQQEWLRWQALVDKEDHSIRAFIDQLPLAEIVQNASAEKAAPLFARGQQRLADLKDGQAKAKQEAVKSSAADLAAAQKTTQAVQNRGTSLLDRILAKQAVTASMPAGPTKVQLERRAALHRIEDIARVLNLLTGARPRACFSMPAMVQQLQQSLRNPISREEVERCLELMAGEITPGFVSVVQSGAVKGVVVVKAGKIGSEELKARLERAGA